MSISSGILHIAEVQSRMEDVDGFVGAVVKLGFRERKRDERNRMFVLLEFEKFQEEEKKQVDSKSSERPPSLLKACVYKRR